MNRWGWVALACLCVRLPASAAAAPIKGLPPGVKLPPNVALTPFDAQPGQMHAFNGSLTAVRHAAHTLTLKMPMQFVFDVPPGTQISVRNGGRVPWEAVRAGGGAEIVARKGKTGWTAVKITLEPGARFPEELSVTTVDGKHITGAAAAEFVVHEPPPKVVSRGLDLGNHVGTYRLAVRPDGTVADVTVVKSAGVKELDERASDRLRQFKFRAGRVTEARVSVTYSSFRR